MLTGGSQVYIKLFIGSTDASKHKSHTSIHDLFLSPSTILKCKKTEIVVGWAI